VGFQPLTLFSNGFPTLSTPLAITQNQPKDKTPRSPMGDIVGNWLGQPQTIAGKDSKQSIIHFWACGYLVPFATVGNAAPLHLLLGLVLMQINCTKTISGDHRALLLFSLSLPSPKKSTKLLVRTSNHHDMS
jgi:hypothetical protein